MLGLNLTKSNVLNVCQVALFVIAICGFGLPMSWGTPGRDEQGKMSIEKMILEVATSIFARARLPSLAYKIGNEKFVLLSHQTPHFYLRHRQNEYHR